MNNKIKIGASVACADFCHLQEDVIKLEKAGVDYLHVDIMDGNFVPNFCLNCDIIKTLKDITSLPIDTHLMIENPERYIKRCVELGSSYVSIHVESTNHIHRALRMISDCGAYAGLAFNPATPLSYLDYVINECDFILIMTVNPGFAGQRLIPSTLSKIAKVKEMIGPTFRDISIQVDGNVSYDNAQLMVSYGADMIVGGTSSIFIKDVEIENAFGKLRSLV